MEPLTARAEGTGLMASPAVTGVDLYWLPLGAGGQSVRLNGRVFEAVAAWLERSRSLRPLPLGARGARAGRRFVIEQAPAWSDERGARRRRRGPGRARAAGRFRLFRYEVRRWRDGVIPDVAEAVESPQRLSDDLDCARRLLELVPQVPTPVWGRDELGAGEMWNSNSLDLVADRPQRPRRRVDPPPDARTSARLAAPASSSRTPAERRASPLRKEVM